MRVEKLRFSFYTKVNSVFNLPYFKTYHIHLGISFIAGEILANFQSIRGRNSFSVCVKMHGGNGDCAWQHTQLFRQSTTDNEYPFELNITFV